MTSQKFKTTFLSLVLILFCSITLFAQKFTLESIFVTPFIYGVTASAKTSDVVFTSVDKGARNVYTAKAPNYGYKKLTAFNEDDGQEITSLTITDDGLWAVFVRGGDHGGNVVARPINPSSSIIEQTIAVYSINLKTGAVKLIGDGDFPKVNAITKQVVYLSKGNIVIAPLDGSAKPKTLFSDLGTARAYKWSPDGKKLVFSSRREKRSFIGIYEEGVKKIRWVSPSYFSDDLPVWSPDGKKVAFIRKHSTGFMPDSVGVRALNAWQIVVHNFETETLEPVYTSPLGRRSETPLWSGSYNLSWTNSEFITFLTYQDGWPHLYRVALSSKEVKQLTKGKFTVDNIDYSTDGNSIAFCANFGDNPEDIDRKQLGVVNIKTGVVKYLTKGDNISSSPTFINKNNSVVFLNGTTKRPGLPAVIDVNGSGGVRLIGKDLLGSFKFDDLVVPEHVRFNSTDGLEVYGQLFKPKNPKEKTAAIVYVHGGPRRQMYLGWHFMDYYFYDYALNQYLASQGYTVLAVNYRLGTGYGYDFQNASKGGKAGASEYQDIKAAGLWLQNQTFVDRDKIGIYGGSYGGYLTAMALGKDSELFKVGVDIHGVHNRVAATEDAPTLSKADLTALKSSPVYWVDGWKSPALIIHGDDDLNVNFTQSVDLANRLMNRKLPIEFLVFPNETHHWMVFENLVKVKKATFNFLDQHLK